MVDGGEGERVYGVDGVSTGFGDRSEVELALAVEVRDDVCDCRGEKQL